jgi:hypothetical protein
MTLATRSELEFKIQYDASEKMWNVSTFSRGQDVPLVTESKKKLNGVLKAVDRLAHVGLTCGDTTSRSNAAFQSCSSCASSNLGSVG